MNYIDVRMIYRRLFDDFSVFLEKEWNSLENRKTILPTWTCKDILIHLTGNALQKLSALEQQSRQITRTGSRPDFKTLSRQIDENNERWLELYRQLDGAVVLDQFHHVYNRLLSRFESIVDLDSRAVHNVLWAHEEESPSWLDIGREYTELWLHATQIAQAEGRKFTMDPDYFAPFIEVCLTALDHHYSRFKKPFKLILDLEGLMWTYSYNGQGQEGELKRVRSIDESTCIVHLRREDAWRLFGGLVPEETIADRVSITGCKQVSERLLKLRCVMVCAY